MPAVPVEQRGGVGHEPALLLGEDHDGVAQPDRPRPLGGAPARAPARRGAAPAASGGGASAARAAARPRRRRRAARARRGRAGAARRAAGASASGTIASRSPARRTPPLPATTARAAGSARCAATHAASRRRPSPGAVEARAGERGHDRAGTTSAASSSSASVSRCRRCWSITRSTPASAYSRSRSATSSGVPASQPSSGGEAGRRQALGPVAHLAVVGADHEAVHEREAQRGGVAPRALAGPSRTRCRPPPRRPGEAWTTLYSSAQRAASAALRGFAAPPMTSGGCGLLHRLGRASRSRTVQCSPAKREPPSVQLRCTISSCSASRSMRVRIVREGEAVGGVLVLVPARAEPELDAAARDVVGGHDELRQHGRVAERGGRDERPEPQRRRHRGEAADRAPGVERPRRRARRPRDR